MTHAAWQVRWGGQTLTVEASGDWAVQQVAHALRVPVDHRTCIVVYSPPAIEPEGIRVLVNSDASAWHLRVLGTNAVSHEGLTSACSGTVAIQSVGQHSPQLALLRAVDTVLTEQLAGAVDCGPVLHGACISNAHGEACMLLAPSTGGKSTLTALLVSAGLRYMSDELCLLAVPFGDASALDVEITGWPRALHLRPGGLQALRSEAIRPIVLDVESPVLDGEGNAWVEPPSPTPTPSLAQSATQSHFSARLKMIIQLEFDGARATNAPCIQRVLTKAEVARLLVAQTVNARNLPAFGVSLHATVARRVPAWTFLFGPEQGSCEAVQSIGRLLSV